MKVNNQGALPPPYTVLLTIAVIQGLALLALYQAYQYKVWPSQTPVFAYPLLAVTVLLPIGLQLALTHTNVRLLVQLSICLLYTSPSPRDRTRSRMPSSA